MTSPLQQDTRTKSGSTKRIQLLARKGMGNRTHLPLSLYQLFARSHCLLVLSCHSETPWHFSLPSSQPNNLILRCRWSTTPRRSCRWRSTTRRCRKARTRAPSSTKAAPSSAFPAASSTSADAPSASSSTTEAAASRTNPRTLFCSRHLSEFLVTFFTSST